MRVVSVMMRSRARVHSKWMDPWMFLLNDDLSKNLLATLMHAHTTLNTYFRVLISGKGIILKRLQPSHGAVFAERLLRILSLQKPALPAPHRRPPWPPLRARCPCLIMPPTHRILLMRPMRVLARLARRHTIPHRPHVEESPERDTCCHSIRQALHITSVHTCVSCKGRPASSSYRM